MNNSIKAHEQGESDTFVPRIFYFRDEYDRDETILDILISEKQQHGEEQGNVIIYVNPTSGEHRLNNLVKFLHGKGFDRRVTTLFDFTTSFNPTILTDRRNPRILIVTRDDLNRIISSSVQWTTDTGHDFWHYVFELTNIVHYDTPKTIHDYK